MVFEKKQTEQKTPERKEKSSKKRKASSYELYQKETFVSILKKSDRWWNKLTADAGILLFFFFLKLNRKNHALFKRF